MGILGVDFGGNYPMLVPPRKKEIREEGGRD
jgi:hypothetical protein